MPNENDKLPVLTDVSPGLHPDSVTPWATVLKDSPALSAARQALHRLYGDIGTIDAAVTATRVKYGVATGNNAQPLRIPDDRAQQLAADIGARVNSTAKLFDQHLAQVDDAISKLQHAVDKSMSNPKSDAMSAAAEQDVRGYFARMPANERLDKIHGMIEAGDVAPLAAVLRSPYAAGFDPEQVAIVKDLASKKFAPKERAQLDAAQAVRAHMERAAGIYAARVQKATPKVTPDEGDRARAALKEGAA